MELKLLSKTNNLYRYNKASDQRRSERKRLPLLYNNYLINFEHSKEIFFNI